MNDLLSREAALECVLQRALPLEAEDVPLEESSGRVLAEPTVARVDLPGSDVSSMDGFALRAADAPGRLRVVARIAAGRPLERRLEPGEAAAIATGGVVPGGADVVVPIEDVEDHGEAVTVGVQLRPGSHVRQRAGDLAAGAVVVDAGVRLGPARLGALAAAGVTALRCRRAPRVTVVVTGTELRPPGAVLGRGEIYDANGVMLAAQARSAGAEVLRLPIVGDDLELTRRAVKDGLSGDVLITSGGVSVGPHDFVRRSLADVGVEEVFWRVALRPGKPIAFAVRDRTLVFGLPGNPVSSLVGFELFVRPALLALQGVTNSRPAFLPGRLSRAVRMLDDRECLLRARARVDGDVVVLEPLSGQESHMIARAVEGNALVLIPRGNGERPAGAAASYLPL